MTSFNRHHNRVGEMATVVELAPQAAAADVLSSSDHQGEEIKEKPHPHTEHVTEIGWQRKLTHHGVNYLACCGMLACPEAYFVWSIVDCVDP